MQLPDAELCAAAESTSLPNYVDTIILGDCCRIMQAYCPSSIDLVLTDPPYLVNYCPRDGRTIAGDSDHAWLTPAFAESYRVLKSDAFCISFYGWTKAEIYLTVWKQIGFRPVGHVVWLKSYASSTGFLRSRHEQAYLLAKGRPPQPLTPIDDVLNWRYTGNRLHPTQKPIGALIPLIRAFSRPGEVVLDPFCGSGSVPLAAKLLGRHYIGIELREDYQRLANQRLSQR